MLIWNGFGIIVPIIFFIVGWIASYFFDDLTLGNTSYIATIMLFSALPVGLIGLGMAQPSEDGTPAKNHSFFFIPVQWWGLLFLVGGLVLKFI